MSSLHQLLRNRLCNECVTVYAKTIVHFSPDSFHVSGRCSVNWAPFRITTNFRTVGNTSLSGFRQRRTASRPACLDKSFVQNISKFREIRIPHEN
jgi:hypothetical protein